MNRQQLPRDFITLGEAIAKPPAANYNVIGICVDFLPAVKSRGDDYTISFVLYDPTWERGDRGMKFRFFNRKLERLPKIQSNGDVVILQTVTTKHMQGLIGISNYGSSWTVLSASSVVDSEHPNGTDIKFTSSAPYSSPSAEMLQYAKLIAGYTDQGAFRTPSKATVLQVDGIIKESGGIPPQRVGKKRLLQDLELSDPPNGRFADGKPAFADLFGEVRRMHKGDYVKAELYLTDYTTNQRLYNYDPNPQKRDGDEFGYATGSQSWPGPWGKMTIHVVCWDAHATFARSQVQEGMYILVKNCQIKLDPNGSRIEATCRGDRDDASRVNIVICHPKEAVSDEGFKNLLKRRREYERMAARKGLYTKNDFRDNSKKRPVDESVSAAGDKSSGRISKSTKRRLRKAAKKANSEAIATDETFSTRLHSNQNVRCNNVDVRLMTIDSILCPEILRRITPTGNVHFLPFQNCGYKAKVKVVDFYPDNIVDFATPRQLTAYDALSDCEEYEDQDLIMTQAHSNPASVDWEWRFVLIVEDANFQPLDSTVAKKQMALFVAGQDAEYLLRESACDLRKQPRELARLKEQLFHLWGDLQEKKEESDIRDTTNTVRYSSKPFECLIKEYGVLKPTVPAGEEAPTDYQRMFKLCGTTISI